MKKKKKSNLKYKIKKDIYKNIVITIHKGCYSKAYKRIIERVKIL